MTATTAPEQHLRDLAWLRRVRDRIDRDYEQPLDVAFYRDVLGFEVRMDVGYAGLRWITVGPPGQPDTNIVLYPPFAAPGITEDEKRTIGEMMAKGTYGILVLSTSELDATFDRIQTADAEVVQEPTDQPYGIRDAAFRDPAGNLIRINEQRPA